jgi:hypothetical protein
MTVLRWVQSAARRDQPDRGGLVTGSASSVRPGGIGDVRSRHHEVRVQR